MAASPTPARLIDRLRTICLAFPEAKEKETWGHPTFRVRDKIFVGAGTSDNGQVTTMSLKESQKLEVPDREGTA